MSTSGGTTPPTTPNPPPTPNPSPISTSGTGSTSVPKLDTIDAVEKKLSDMSDFTEEEYLDALKTLTSEAVGPTKDRAVGLLRRLYASVKLNNNKNTFLATNDFKKLLDQSSFAPLNVRIDGTGMEPLIKAIAGIEEQITYLTNENNFKIALNDIVQGPSKGVPKELIQKVVQRVIKPTEVDESGWDTIIGNLEAVNSLKVSFLLPTTQPKLVGTTNRAPGVGLYGPPGTGKTSLGRAVAWQASRTKGVSVRFEPSGPSDILGKSLGESEKNIKALWEWARNWGGTGTDMKDYRLLSKPEEFEKYQTILFIDEADGILQDKSSSNQSYDISRVNEWIQNMDGIVKGPQISTFVIIATNYPWKLESAVVSRLGDMIYVSLPSYSDRISLVTQYIRKANAKGATLPITIDFLKDVKLKIDVKKLEVKGYKITASDFFAHIGLYSNRELVAFGNSLFTASGKYYLTRKFKDTKPNLFRGKYETAPIDSLDPVYKYSLLQLDIEIDPVDPDADEDYRKYLITVFESMVTVTKIEDIFNCAWYNITNLNPVKSVTNPLFSKSFSIFSKISNYYGKELFIYWLKYGYSDKGIDEYLTEFEQDMSLENICKIVLDYAYTKNPEMEKTIQEYLPHEKNK